MNNPIFIIGAHKSGSSLVRNILDGHPELFVLSVETHFFSISKCIPVEYPFNWHSIPHSGISQKEIVDHLIYYLSSQKIVKQSKVARYSDSTFYEFNIDIFQKSLNDYINCGLPLFTSYLYAIVRSIEDIDPSNKRLVEKSVSNCENAAYLKSLYPSAKFVHIIRNPISNYLSFKKYSLLKGGKYNAKDIINALYLSYLYAIKNEQLLPDYLVIKYEDLISDTNECIGRIIEHLQLNYEEILEQPTVMGKNWYGNSTSGENISGIKKVESNKSIDFFEKKAIEKKLGFAFQYYKYDTISNGALPDSIFTFKGGIKNYVYNKLMHHYI